MCIYIQIYSGIKCPSYDPVSSFIWNMHHFFWGVQFHEGLWGIENHSCRGSQLTEIMTIIIHYLVAHYPRIHWQVFIKPLVHPVGFLQGFHPLPGVNLLAIRGQFTNINGIYIYIIPIIVSSIMFFLLSEIVIIPVIHIEQLKSSQRSLSHWGATLLLTVGHGEKTMMISKVNYQLIMVLFIKLIHPNSGDGCL